MAVNLFDTRTMIPMLTEAKPAQSFLRDRYFSDIRRFDTKKVEIDIWKGKRKLAPYVHPKIGGKTVERQGFTVDEFEAPEVSPDMVTTAEDMLQRLPGETIYGAMSPTERAAEQLGRDLAELDTMITRREEQQAAEALFTGQVTVTGEGYGTKVIKYWPDDPAQQPYLALGAGSRWSESGGNPLKDFRTARRTILQESGVNPIDAILGQDAIEALMSNESFVKQLDNRRIDMGLIDPSNLPNGVTYWGYLKNAGIDLWTYDEWYLNDEGDEVPMVPTKEVLIGSPQVRTTRAYGVVSLMKGNDAPPEFYALERVPDSWSQRKNPAGRIVQIKSKPLAIINQIGGFRVLKVLA